MFWRYEPRRQSLLPRWEFVKRVAIIGGSLGLSIPGDHFKTRKTLRV